MAEVTREQWPEIQVRLRPMETHLHPYAVKLTFHVTRPAFLVPSVVDRPPDEMRPSESTIEIPLALDDAEAIANLLGEVVTANGRVLQQVGQMVELVNQWERKYQLDVSSANAYFTSRQWR